MPEYPLDMDALLAANEARALQREGLDDAHDPRLPFSFDGREGESKRERHKRRNRERMAWSRARLRSAISSSEGSVDSLASEEDSDDVPLTQLRAASRRRRN